MISAKCDRCGKEIKVLVRDSLDIISMQSDKQKQVIEDKFHKSFFKEIN